MRRSNSHNINSSNQKLDSNLKLPRILTKTKVKKVGNAIKPHSFHCSSYQSNLSNIYQFESLLREYASEVRDNHKEIFTQKNRGKSEFFRMRKINFDLFPNKFEDYYLKRDRTYLNNYHNKYIRDHINEILDHQGCFKYIAQEKIKVFKEDLNYAYKKNWKIK